MQKTMGHTARRAAAIALLAALPIGAGQTPAHAQGVYLDYSPSSGYNRGYDDYHDYGYQSSRRNFRRHGTRSSGPGGNNLVDPGDVNLNRPGGPALFFEKLNQQNGG